MNDAPLSQRDLVEAWHAYVGDPRRYRPETFTFLFAESSVSPGAPITVDEITALLPSSPAMEQIIERLERWIAYRNGDVTSTDDNELTRLVAAHIGDLRKEALRHGLTGAVQRLDALEIVTGPVLLDQNRYEPADELYDEEYWDVVALPRFRDMSRDPGLGFLPGLREACWGIATDRFVVWHLINPVVGLGLDLSSRFDVALRGCHLRIEAPQVIVGPAAL